MTLRTIVFCFLIVGVTSKEIHLAKLDHTEVGSDCPRNCLYAEEDRMVFHGTAMRSRDENINWKFDNIEILTIQHGTKKWIRICRPDFRYWPSLSGDVCYCNRRISYEKRSFVVNVTAQRRYSNGSLLAMWKSPNTHSKSQVISEIQVIPIIKYRPKETLRVNGTLVPLSYCEIALYENTSTSIEYCVLNLEKPYTVTLNFSTQMLQNVSNIPCVSDTHRVTKEHFKKVKYYVFMYNSPYERKTTTCEIVVFERAVIEENCKNVTTYIGHVSVIVNRRKYDLTEKHPPCNLSLEPDKKYTFSVCLDNPSSSHHVSSNILINGSYIHGRASPCMGFVHTPTSTTFINVYIFTLTDECLNSKKFSCNVKLIGQETVTTSITTPGHPTNTTWHFKLDDGSWSFRSVILWTIGLLLLALLSLLCLFQASKSGRKSSEEYPEFADDDPIESYLEEQDMADGDDSDTESPESVGTSVDDTGTSVGGSSLF